MHDGPSVDGADPLGQALDAAYRYLSRRERTESEMRGRLGRSFDAPTVTAALEVLRDLGYVDDARYARMFVQDKRSLEQWGSERIERVLRSRGIDHEVIETALRDDPAGAEADRALELLKRRFRLPLADPRDRERALGVLLRKGFDSELAIEAVTSYARRGG